jgi:hypothetical protein
LCSGHLPIAFWVVGLWRDCHCGLIPFLPNWNLHCFLQ